MRLSIFFAAALFAVLACLPETWSQQGVGTVGPIRIEADRMESSRENSAVLFFGNVKASQDSLTIQADEMTVLYTREEAADAPAGSTTDPSRRIESIKARGQVKIVQGDWIAAGDTMDFNAAERIVTLAGKATAWQEQNMVSGEKIILYLDEGKSVVESDSQQGERVEAFIYPSAPEK